MEKVEGFRKLTENPYGDLYWNLPEAKQGWLNVVGGNKERFHAPVSIANSIREKWPVEKVVTILPDAVRPIFQDFPDVAFGASTESGSFRDGAELSRFFGEADFNLVVGDLSKNSVTVGAIVSAVSKSEKPVLLTRDAVDLFAEGCGEADLLNERVMFFGSMVQMQKIFRAVYYPKVLLLSQPLLQVVEALHKFTLSYPVTLITFHAGQFLVARDGRVEAVPFEKAGISMVQLWGGEVASRIAVLNMFNPGKSLEASVASMFRV